MRPFFEKTLAARHRHGHRQAAAIAVRLQGLDPGRQEGFLLVEVMVSALLVAMIVTATFNGLDVATRLTSDQRTRGQAALLAAQSQEQLRTLPASALDALETSPHKYTTAVGGTTYTITQEAKAVSASGNTTGCSATETTAQTGANILVISRVSWARQVSSHRPEVKQASIITPPTGSAIEVDVLNGVNEGVAGVTARAEFIPNEAGSYNTVEGTTGSNGCIVLTGIQSTSAKLSIVEKAGYVTPTGALKVETKELTIAPNITTHDVVEYAEAGRIAARFTYKGAEVKSDTFVAFNTETGIKPEYEVGSTSFAPFKSELEEPYKALTGSYATVAYTAAGGKYPSGRLFDFKGPWQVYAGDCPANKAAGETASATVTSGSTTTVNVPTSYTKLSVYTGVDTAEPGSLDPEGIRETSKNVIKITNTSCAGAEEPLNAYAATNIHEQRETLPEGRLEDPFQPFGNFSLCLYEPKQQRTYTTSYTNSVSSEGKPVLYLKQKTTEEKEKEIATAKTEEAEFKTEKTEYEAGKAKRAGEETTANAAKAEREADAKGPESKAYWEKLEAEGKLTKATREGKEKTKAAYEAEYNSHKISKTTLENDEKTPETKVYWERQRSRGEITANELAVNEKTKATLASEETAAALAKAKRAEEETTAKKANETREGEEATFATAKKQREERETAEAKNGVTVQGNKSSC